MQEAEAQETPPPSPERANPFQFYYSPPFQFVAFSSPPLVLAGVAFQLGSRVISERRSLNVSSSGCRGREKKKKRKEKKRGGGKGGGGGGKKSPPKTKREFVSVESLSPGAEALATPLSPQYLQSVKFDAPEPSVFFAGGGGRRLRTGMLRTKPLRGHAGVPLPSGSKKQKTK